MHLLVAFGYVSSSSSTTPILSSGSDANEKQIDVFPSSRVIIAEESPFEPLGEKKKKKKKRKTKAKRNNGENGINFENCPRRKANEEKETNALDAEIELEKDEHLLQHLPSLNDNIETQEKETLKLVKMKAMSKTRKKCWKKN